MASQQLFQEHYPQFMQLALAIQSGALATRHPF
jgi:hypothetical protein